ncbi:MAG: CPBP family intramembrane metalloprotease [Acholeplasmatales bacterium]|nr:MAG: CPBP family intramembrane metalloprotease [Acholeplasmatales bacterium]
MVSCCVGLNVKEKLMIFSVVVFLITGLAIYAGVYFVTPKLIAKGVPKIYAFWTSLWLPVYLLVPVSLLHYRFVEQGALTWEAMQMRYNLYAVSGRHLVWILIAIVLTLVIEESLQPLSRYFARKRWFAPPSYLPAPFNPLKKFTMPPKTFFGVRVKGNYRLLVMFIPLHVLAMMSEELMWRGYILPMQIATFGSYAWLVNGLMWAYLVHACLKWHFIAMLPSMLIVPYVAQSMGSTVAAFYLHAVPNTLLWVILYLGIRGKKTHENDVLKTS